MIEVEAMKGMMRGFTLKKRYFITCLSYKGQTPPRPSEIILGNNLYTQKRHIQGVTDFIPTEQVYLETLKCW